MTPACRPWWRRKRWLAAGLLWLAVAYPLSPWATEYLGGRRLISPGGPVAQVLGTAYWPLAEISLTPTGPRRGFGWYFDAMTFFRELGERHAASE